MNTLVESSTMANSGRKLSDDVHGSLFNETKWEWSYLRRKCRNLEVEQYYESYMHRLRISYLSLFVFINALVAFVHIALLVLAVSDPLFMYVDIIAYICSAVFVWLILSINFREHLIQRKSWIMYITSWIAVVLMLAADLIVPVYHSVTNHYVLRPSYSGYILYGIYIFLPLPHDAVAFLTGVAVTASYLIAYNYVTFRMVEDDIITTDYNKLISEAIFLSCINMFGVYFRMMKEIAIRTTFLDRRQCVEENLLLRFARDQEKNLLLSIIPAQIANKIEQDVKMRIEQLKIQNLTRTFMPSSQSATPPVKRWRQPDTEKLFIEPHNDVSVLYADVVNYTYLTTTLDVRTLVETLHDLFVKFDLASEEYNVLRIKFLGDCYYCVAGVPIPNEHHAKCCTDLGLRMISDIRDVRMSRQLNIDMRIGVHSGNILSGVIGACKWQFDIWSKDVDIANRLEQTGVAGRVHVSEQTLQLLDGEYLYEEGTKLARDDLVLRKYRIHTFLIKPPKTPSIPRAKRPQTSGRRQTNEHKPKPDLSTNFMQNTIVQYNQIRAQAKLEMNREMDKMPIGRIQVARLCFGRNSRLTQDEIEEQNFRSNITSCCLFFKDWRWEFSFMREPDVMLKYSLLFALLTLAAIAGIQAINESQSYKFWVMSVINFSTIVIFLFCAWYKKLWIMLTRQTELARPRAIVNKFFCRLSDKIQKSVVTRVVMYLLMMIMYATTALLQLVDCDRIAIENADIDVQLFHDGERNNLCFNPWAITESMILTICMSFLFTRIPFVLKFSVATATILLYAIIILFEYDFIYEKSPTTNVGLYTEYSHLMALLITLGMFHLMDRQTEFISKVDYNWNRQLQKKQEDAKFTNETIKILINNILPTHVADIYMTKKMHNELYFEEYDNVAVMFATIKNYNTEKVGLRVLNEIICDFDAVLNFYKGPLKIEKIKVAGWTYMAACGLDVTRSEHGITPAIARGSTLTPNGRRSHHAMNSETSADLVGQSSTDSKRAAIDGRRAPKIRGLLKRPDRKRTRHITDMTGHRSNESKNAASDGRYHENRRHRRIMFNKNREWDNVVYVMVNFALDLMKTMNAFNLENLQYEETDKDRAMLRIGISSGEVMAGVVGSHKPHYDIWGNSVNMSSRMDSTGVPGRIQVTKETAIILQTFNIKCVYRGLTFVKGRGEIPTYFIALDKDLNFVKSKDEPPILSTDVISAIPAGDEKNMKV